MDALRSARMKLLIFLVLLWGMHTSSATAASPRGAALLRTEAERLENVGRGDPAAHAAALLRSGRAYASLYAREKAPRDLESALSALVRAAAVAPGGRTAAVALMQRARLLLEHRPDKTEARAALTQLLHQYPQSAEARTARRLLLLLRAFDPTRRARNVVAVREEVGPASTRIVIELDGALRELPVPVAHAPLDRVRVPLLGVRAPKALLAAREGRGLASRIRLHKLRKGLLLDATLRQSAQARVFHLSEPSRLVIDLAVPESPPASAATPAPSPPVRAPLLQRVVIDPGHGGKDSGALGRMSRLREKDVALSIALKLAALLRAIGVEALLTRDGDETLALRERTAFANERGADLFLSIHVNSNPDPSRHGLETYYLDTTRDRYAARLAKRENDAGGDRSDLQYILADLHTQSNVQTSMQLAGHILRAAVQHLSGRHADIAEHGVKPALFYVLLGAKMPAVLVETSYLTNARDEKRLQDDAYLQRLAEGIFLGVRRFVLGSKVAMR
jgi:N-acetylmuramoyl-L-alanine amidase